MRLPRLLRMVARHPPERRDPLQLLAKNILRASEQSTAPQYVEYGHRLVQLLLNEHLGTRNAELPAIVLKRYDELHAQGDAGVETVLCNICIADIYLGRVASRKIANKILTGPQGLANLYLDALSNNDM